MVTWWDGFNLAYAYDTDGEMTSIQPSGANSAISVLASYSYDDLGRRTGVTRGNNVTSAYGYDGISRLTSLSHTMSGGNIQNQTYGLAYTASSQVKGVTLSNLAYEYSPSSTSNTSTVNGLNELSTSGGATISYDARGNLSSNSVTNYSYDLLNRLQSTSGRSTTSTAYDPQDRLITLTAGGVTTQFAYIGPNVSTELNPSGGQIYRRYVPGPAEDETVVWYEGADASRPRWLLEDHQGSIVAVTNTTGGAIGINIYDEYGAPAAANIGKFQYTGQLWLPEIGVYDYKARLYSGALGRFMQTDPVGYKDGLNWYVYVHDDPIDQMDSSGTESAACQQNPQCTSSDSKFAGGSGKTDKSNFKQKGGSHSKGIVSQAVDAAIQDFADHPLLTAFNVGIGLLTNIEDGEIGAPPTAAALEAGELGGAKAVEGVLARFAGKACGCFVAGTLVETAQGLRPIERIKVGDRVLSRSDLTGETAYKPVTDLIRPHHRRIYAVRLEQPATHLVETFDVTDDHPWRSIQGRWLTTLQLKSGAQIQTEHGPAVKVVSVIRTQHVTDTYNLEIGEFHTFFVGKEGVWVHNACSDLVKAARDLGYKLDKGFGRMHGQDVFKNGSRYITRDVDSHSGGVWKMFDRQGNRLGTFDKDLNRIGD